jgi:hypothetical protein
MASIGMSSRCMELVNEYKFDKQSIKLVATCVGANIWVAEDLKHVQDLRELWAAVKVLLKRVEGQERFKFPADLAAGLNQAMFLNKTRAAGHHARDLDHFIEDCQELSDAQRTGLKAAVI